MATIGPGGNYFSQINQQLAKGPDAKTAENLRHTGGTANTQRKSSTAKKGAVSEEGSTLSDAAQRSLQTAHKEAIEGHEHELAQQAGLQEADPQNAENQELRRKRGYDREQEELMADGHLGDGRVKLTSPEGAVQVMSVDDHDYLKKMDDPDVTDSRLLDDIPEANLNAANATLETQMAQGVSKVAVLKTDPKVDAVAEVMEVHPLPALAEPMDIVGPGSDKTSKPVSMEFPPEMERVAAEKAAAELASGEMQQEAILAGPGMPSPTLVAPKSSQSVEVGEVTAASAGAAATESAGAAAATAGAAAAGAAALGAAEQAAKTEAPPKTAKNVANSEVAGIPATTLEPGATVDRLKDFADPLIKAQMEQARSGLSEAQKKDLSQIESDVSRIRSLYREMGEKSQDKDFVTKAQKELQECQSRVGEVHQRNQSKNSNFYVTLDPNNNGEVYTTLKWSRGDASPEMQAQGAKGVAYELTSSPGKTDHMLTAFPVGQDGQPLGAYVKYRVASGDAKGWQGVAAVMGDVNGENGFHASTVNQGDNRLYAQMQTDPNRVAPYHQALARQTMSDLGLTWPGGSPPPEPQNYRNVPGQQQQPVQPGWLDRMRYAFTGDNSYLGGPPPYWQPPMPTYSYHNPYPQNFYPPVQYPGVPGGYPGGYPGGNWGGSWGGSWGGDGGGMGTLMKVMMATTMISSMAMPLCYFANSMFW